MSQTLKISYQKRLFILLLSFSWILVGCFILFQYNREKQYKIDKLNTQLQLYNQYLIYALNSDSMDFNVLNKHLPIENLRVSVIGKDGYLIFDNTLDSLPGENHLSRHEIAEAVKTGQGYTVRRHSSSIDNSYFYSATKKGDTIVRSAVPYSLNLSEILRADSSFLWFMLVVTLLLSIIGYFATRRIGRTITRLNRFAERAEKGERIYDEGAFPRDELGSISNHIIRLYARLQQTMTERDQEHSRVLHEQQEKNRIKRQLTNNINHELKTPVAAIKISLETILDHPELPNNKQLYFISQCYTQTERLTNLLNDIADITRLEDGQSSINKENLDLIELINETIEMESITLQQANFTIERKLPLSIIINGNKTYLTSIFRNLITNAIAYSAGNKITIAIENLSSDLCTISFADNGCGIPSEHHEHIFERFYRIDKGRSRQNGGTGLGLSIVKNAVCFHGGTIKVINLRLGGAKFIFTLRLHPQKI